MVGSWLDNLLSSSFFGVCPLHERQNKNSRNFFCLDCEDSFCHHCIKPPSSTHYRHNLLQIRRNCFKDVVRVIDMKDYFDCSGIQTYAVNNAMTVYLNPRTNSRQWRFNDGSQCGGCERILSGENLFCSIACKKSVIFEQNVRNNPQFVLNQVSDESNSNEISPQEMEGDKNCTSSTNDSTTLKPKKPLHRRKGIPRRSPIQ